MSLRGVLLTLVTVSAIHAGLIYPLLTQQVERFPEVKKRVIRGIVLAPSPMKVDKPSKIKPPVKEQVAIKPEQKKQVVQKPIERPKPKSVPVIETEIPDKVVEEAPETPEPTQDIEEMVESAPQTQPENSVVEGEMIPPHIDDAVRMNNPSPIYPRLSKRLREEGVVILDLWVLADGSVADVNIKISSGHPRLDNAALEAVKMWRYKPANQNGEAIAYRYEQPVEFAMK
jgi:protein TonB